MARNSPCFGSISSISELNLRLLNNFDGVTVRVTGRMVSHDFVKREAVLRDIEVKVKTGAAPELTIDTSLVEPLPACQLIQVIGEIECLPNSPDYILHARVARDVEDLDMTTWTKAVKLRKEYLETNLLKLSMDSFNSTTLYSN